MGPGDTRAAEPRGEPAAFDLLVTGGTVVTMNGRILMEGRRVLVVDEAAVLAAAQEEADAAIDRAGLRGLMDLPPKFWGHSRFLA